MNTHPNPELQLAHDFVQYTNCHIFLTGKAGTGKTTFLHNLKKNSHKRMIVTAPTGVAAINAGGVTLHSFFQMPFGPFVPGSEAHSRSNQHKFSKEKINIIRSLDLLVIDEISMVRADLLDGVDAVLRRFRRSEQPFGGVQLLMIGDLHQLPPVVKGEEWNLLREFYDSFYFFASSALRATELVTIELKHIYRQSDQHFIELLNQVRDNRLDPASLRQLNSRCLPNFVPGDGEGYITLSTHNTGADALNEAKLRSLRQQEYRFAAEIEGEFPEYSYPTAPALRLKKGAQVMFVRNDASRNKLYFNGKIGRITRIADETVFVKCPGDQAEIAVEPATWENIKYQLDPQTREITENKAGTFTQVPLKLAWAITIHKSQGLTFERAIIDARAAFAHGQVYVALSRCKTFEGMVLSSPIPTHAVKTDGTVASFMAQVGKDPPSTEKLAAAKISYQQHLLTECLDFARLRLCLGWLVGVLLSNARIVRVSGAGELRELQQRAENQVFVVSENFRRQLAGLFASGKLPEADGAVLERTGKASAYFQQKLEAVLGDCLRNLRIDTDNQEVAKKVKLALDELKKEAAVKFAAVRCCQGGFSPAQYLRAVSVAEIDWKPRKDDEKKAKAMEVEYTASDIKHPKLFAALKEWRADRAAEAEVQQYRIMRQSVLIQIAASLPDNLTALKRVKGIGGRTAEKYGKELLDLVLDYRQKHNIREVVPAVPKAALSAPLKEKTPASNTRQVSFEMISKGLTIAQVARERGLAASTVEGHLAFFVETGKLAIGMLLPAEKQQAIERKLSEMEDRPLGDIKSALGEAYSYGEIKLVQAHLKYLEG